MKGEKQLFGRTGNIAPTKNQEAQLRITDTGRIIFPSQEKIFGQLSHILGVFKDSEADIRPHSHLTGPSGSGKSFLLKMVCDEHKIPMIEVNAAGLTTEGLSGNSLSKALRKLREHWNEPNVIFVDEFDKLFLRNGFTIKERQADLKPYVYAAADELMSIARAALSAPSHGGDV